MSTRRAFLASLSAAAAPGQDLHWLSIDQAAALIRARKLSPLELTRHCLARIEKLNPRYNAFITVTSEQALADARRLESEKPRGPLHGIPIALKDLYDTQGVRTTAASQQFANRVPTADAEVVRRLKAAGAIIVGKANMDEFAYNYTSETSFYGPCRNPWDPALSPGGSSGGSAVAVAAGMCFAALGSDTGGSIRLPSAFCGIAGFKPSWGQLPVDGVLPLSWTLDTVGPMARSARDCAILFQAMGGAAGRPAKPPRIGIPRKPFFDQVPAELFNVAKLFPGAREVPFPAVEPSPVIPELTRPYLEVLNAEAYAYHRDILRKSPGLYHPQTRQNIANGESISAAAYIASRREMERLRALAGTLFPAVDLLISPTAPGPAFPLGQPGSLLFLRNTALWNLFGLPTITVPCGLSLSGLPLGIQITGRPGDDSLVLSAAAAFQKENALSAIPSSLK